MKQTLITETDSLSELTFTHQFTFTTQRQQVSRKETHNTMASTWMNAMTTLGFATMANEEDQRIADAIQPQPQPNGKDKRLSKRERQAANREGQKNITDQLFETVSTKQEQEITDPCFGYEKRVYTDEEESTAKRIIENLCNLHGYFFKKSSHVSHYNTRLTAGKSNGQRECSCCGTGVPRTVATGLLRDDEGKRIFDEDTGLYETGPIKNTYKGKEVNRLVPGSNGNYFAVCQGPKGQGCGKGLVCTQYTVRSSDGETHTYDTDYNGKGHAEMLDEWFDLGLVTMCPFDTQHPYFPGAAIDPNTRTLGSFLKKNHSEQLEERRQARKAEFEQKRQAKKEDDGFTPVKTRPAKPERKGQKMLCTTDDCSFVCWTSFQGPPSTFKCNRCRGVKPRSKSTK